MASPLPTEREQAWKTAMRRKQTRFTSSRACMMNADHHERYTSSGKCVQCTVDRDGRRTEIQLQQWFTTIDPESELGTQLSAALYGFLAGYGKSPSTKIRINVPNKVYETHFVATAPDPHDILVATLIAAAKTLPPSHFEKLRAQLFGR